MSQTERWELMMNTILDGKLDRELIKLHFSHDPCAFWEGEEQMCSSVLDAAMSGDLGLIKQLHANGVSLTIADYDLRTAGHLACVEGNLEIVKYLKQNGVNFNVKDRWGQTAMQEAEATNRTEIISYIKTGRLPGIGPRGSLGSPGSRDSPTSAAAKKRQMMPKLELGLLTTRYLSQSFAT